MYRQEEPSYHLSDDDHQKSGGGAKSGDRSQAAAFVDSILAPERQMETSLSSQLVTIARKIHQIVAWRDYPDVMRSWPLSWSTQEGPWFENLPIEVLPRLPETPPSDCVRDRVRQAAGCSLTSQCLDAQKVFSILFEPCWFYQLGESDRRHALWMAFGMLMVDANPWTRDNLYNLPWPPHPDCDVRSLLVSLAYVDLPWPPAERCIYAATHDTDEPVFIKAFRICGRRHDERAMDHLSPIVRSPAAVLKELAAGRMYYPVGHAACTICPAQFAILGTDDPQLAAIREEELRRRMRRPLSERVEHARTSR
jgi:hypothetical protein